MKRGQTEKLYAGENKSSAYTEAVNLFVAPPVEPWDQRGTAWAATKARQAAHTKAREQGRVRCELFANLVTSSPWWVARGLPRHVLVGKQPVNATASRGGLYSVGWKIRLTYHQMNPAVVLHELAHVVAWSLPHPRPCGHDPQYAAWFGALVALGLGREHADHLVASIEAEGASVDLDLFDALVDSMPDEPSLWERYGAAIQPPPLAGVVVPSAPPAPSVERVAAKPVVGTAVQPSLFA